ncbi:MAG: DUF2795 domain-containing protein [Thiobacillaceae bacterium]|jgi:hypothetical protein|nr:DUF2795 domain-containing protein [Thiobacillaceae bacterium]
MIVTNRHRVTAIVIRHDGATVTLVPMKGGKLSARRLPHWQFARDWREAPYSLAHALARFLRHARQQGASQEVIMGLERLERRDRCVVASLI